MRITPNAVIPINRFAMGVLPGIDADFQTAFAQYEARSPELGTTALVDPLPPSTTAGFMDGLKTWQNPLDAFSALKSSFQGDVTDNLAYVGGLAVPPLVILMLLLGGGRRRFF